MERYRKWTMAAGLAAAFGGDVCLVGLCASTRSMVFLLGVLFFSLAHLLWAAANLREAKMDLRVFVFAAVPLAIFCGVRLGPHLPLATAIAVVVYAVISGFDLSMAFATRRRYYLLGCVFLVVSDVMIGMRMLRMPGVGALVGPLYVAALVMLYVSTFRSAEPRLAGFGNLGFRWTLAFALVAFAFFVVAAFSFPGGAYNPCMRMLSALGRTQIHKVHYPLCHWLFTAGMVSAALGVMKIGRTLGAAVNAAGLLAIAFVPENVSMAFHNAGCWIAVAGGVMMLKRYGSRRWIVALISTALLLGVFLLLHEMKVLPFAPYVPTVQKMLIVSFAVWVVLVDWRGRS